MHNVCGKIKNSNDPQALDKLICFRESGKMLSLVGVITAELVFYLGIWSQNDATWEKNNKTLVCCIKSTRELTIPDSWWGTQNCVETHTEYPVLNASNTCFGKSPFSLHGRQMSLLSNRCLVRLGKSTVSTVSNKQPCLTLCGKKLQNRCVGLVNQWRRRKQGVQELGRQKNKP